MTTPLHLLAAVASTTSPDRATLAVASKAALDDVILPALAEGGIQTSLQVYRRGENLSAPSGWAPAGVDWERVHEVDSLDGFAVAVTGPSAARGDEGLAMIYGSCPGPRRLVDGSMGVSEATVSWSLRRDATKTGSIDRGLQNRAVEWTQRSFDQLGAATGYLTLDHVTASPDGYSPYEQATYRMSAQRDFETHVWTSCWGMPLTKRHVDALGGPGALHSDDHLSRPLLSGAWWLQASEDIESLTSAQIEANRKLLEPLLPVGAQDLTDYTEVPALRV